MKPNLVVVGKEDGMPEGVLLNKNVYYGLAPVDRILPNPFQPRKIFDEAELEMLAETIRENGDVEEDIRLVDNENGTFTLINGERRWRASKMAGLTYVSAKIYKNITQKKLLEKACLANFCVADMTLVEKAFAFRDLMNENGWSQAELARKIGKSQGTVSNALRIFNLHEDIQAMALYNKIDPGLALRLAGFEKEDQGLLLNFCRDEIKERGKPFSPSEALVFIRKKADENGITPRKNKRKSRKTLPHYSLIARSTERAVDRFIGILEELSGLEPYSLRRMRDPALSVLIAKLEDVEEMVFETKKKLEAINEER